jgi:HlyD family secretion protein
VGKGRQRSLMLLAAIAVMLGTASVTYQFDKQTGVRTPGPAAPSPPPERAAVGALGRIEPASEIVNVSAGISDRLERLLVRRGDLVKKAEVIGYLQSYAEQVAQRDEIAAELEESKAKLATEIELDLARIEDATIKLKTIDEVTPLKIEAQVKTIESQEAHIANDKDILDALTRLEHDRFASRRSHADQKSLVTQEEATLASARAQLAQLRSQYDLDRQEAQTQIRLTRAMLERAKADIPVASLTKQLLLADERVRRATISSPIDGTILNVIAHPGELVGGDKKIVTMGDTSRMRAVAEVYETDIARVQLGQRATITSRAFERPITGKVVELGRMVFKNDVLNVDPAARADARVVEVRIELDDAEAAAGLTNLTVDVLINGDESPVAAASTPGRVEQ